MKIRFSNKMKIYLTISILFFLMIFTGVGWKIPLGMSLVFFSFFLNLVNKELKNNG